MERAQNCYCVAGKRIVVAGYRFCRPKEKIAEADIVLNEARPHLKVWGYLAESTPFNESATRIRNEDKCDAAPATATKRRTLKKNPERVRKMKFESIENFKRLSIEASCQVVGGAPGNTDTTKKTPPPVLNPKDTTGTGPVYVSTYCKVNGMNTWDKFD